MRTPIVLCGLALFAWAASATTVAAQARGARGGAPGVQGGARTGAAAAPAVTANVPDDPFQGPVVTGAPFSADATTTVTQVLSDGTRIEENTTARFYRDGAGRLRREQSVLGLGPLNPSREPMTTITIDPDPGDAVAYTLDTANRTARRVNRSSGNTAVFYIRSNNGLALNGVTVNGNSYAARDVERYYTVLGQNGDLARRVVRLDGATTEAVTSPVESLGTRQMEGLTVVGKRTKTTIPAGQIGNDRPIEITDERWESADLKLLVRSHHHDPRTGDIEYQLTNVIRAEPPADLFVVPGGYKIDDGAIKVPTLTIAPSGAFGARGAGGARSGGARSGAPAN
jgi:hypothetical protein